MNRTAIKNFAIWARNKLIADITYKAGLIGVSEKGIASPLPQSRSDLQFFDIGTKEYGQVAGVEIKQRDALVRAIKNKEKNSDYKTAYKTIIEEVAYTWFNRLIAIRFMEVNDYLPSRVRVLSSESIGKIEPDFVTRPFDTDLEFSDKDSEVIMQLKDQSKLDELFRMLFIMQCNKLHQILPMLFEETSDYTELLLTISFTDTDGIVYHLTHDVDEADFDVEKEGQVEIIGWMYQFYNTELNEQVYDGSLSRDKISQELLPAATTIYTPDWAVRYMLENSLGRMWLEGHFDNSLKSEWKYYLEDVEQEVVVKNALEIINADYSKLRPEDIKLIDPCMGSGHILVYAFDVFMKIYESQGYSTRDIPKLILENNIYGLDIDNRASQLAYFAVLMKARQYDRRIFGRGISANIYSIRESNDFVYEHLKFFGSRMSGDSRKKAFLQVERLLQNFVDAKEYGSILIIDGYDWNLLREFVKDVDLFGQMSLDTIGLEHSKTWLENLIDIGETMSQKYHVICTNPPYLGNSRFDAKLDKYVKDYYSEVKADLSMVMYKHAIDTLAQKNGFIAFITTSSWMFLSSFEKLRKYMQEKVSISSLVDFGTELFDGKVGHNPIVSWVSRVNELDIAFTAVRLVDYCYSRRDEKEPEYFNKENYYYSKLSNFNVIAGAPIAYYSSRAFFENFSKGKSVTYISDFTGAQHKTADNDKYLRYWFEVNHKNKKWVPYIKGGEFRKWYGNLDLVVDWSDEAIAFYKNNKTSNLIAEKYRFSEGITYTSLSSGANGFRYLPAIGVFDIKGPSLVRVKNLYYILALFNSKVAYKYFKTFNSTITLQVKDVKALPVIIDKDYLPEIEDLAKENVAIEKEDWDSFESSWDFKAHPFIVYKTGSTLAETFEKWSNITQNRFTTVRNNEERINELFIHIYNMKSELDPELNDREVTVHLANKEVDVKSFMSYMVGCIFGRYSLEQNGLICTGKEFKRELYTKYIPDIDNCLPITDEPYFEDDIISRICEFLVAVYGQTTLEDNLNFIAEALGNKKNTSRDTIRDYFLNDFFNDHCRLCTVGVGGKRPIYWLFDSGKQNGFKALVYMHRWSADTVGNVRVEYLHKVQHIYEREISRMQEIIDSGRDSKEINRASKRQAKLVKQLQETKDYDAKLAHIALSRIEIDLDDGVKVNYEKVQTGKDGKKQQILAKI